MNPSGVRTGQGFPAEGVLTRRLVAGLVDLLLLSALTGALWAALAVFAVVTLGLGLHLLAALPLLPFAYHALFLASPLSATPGQALLGLAVRRIGDGGRPDLLQAALWTGGFYATLAGGAVLLGVALFTPGRRTLHDMLSGLVVARREALTPRSCAWIMPDGRPTA